MGRKTAEEAAAHLKTMKDGCLEWYRLSTTSHHPLCFAMREHLGDFDEWSKVFGPFSEQTERDLAEVRQAIDDYPMFFGEVGI